MGKVKVKYKPIQVPGYETVTHRRSKKVHFTQGYLETWCGYTAFDENFKKGQGYEEIGVDCQRCIAAMAGY